MSLKVINFSIAIVLILTYCTAPDTPSSHSNEEKIAVGVFNGNGASPVCVLETMEALKIDSSILPLEISSSDIMNGQLDRLDVLVFPGGSGSKEFNNLGQLAAKKVKAFSHEQGKGIVGICAGGYLLANTSGYPSLKILDVSHFRDHYDRGRGLISFNLNAEGKEVFPELKNLDSLYIQYYDGPIYDMDSGTKSKSLGGIYTNIATHEDDPQNITQGKPPFLTMDYGKGKVMVSVGHPEATAGMRWMVPRMARWVANEKLISYAEDVVRPKLNDKEILFFAETKKAEKQMFWNLASKNDSIVIATIQELHELRSRPSIRWSIGLLRHHSFEVRLAAAKYLLESEYTYAIPDMKTAVENETDSEQKKTLILIYDKLTQVVNHQTS